MRPGDTSENVFPHNRGVDPKTEESLMVKKMIPRICGGNFRLSATDRTRTRFPVATGLTCGSLECAYISTAQTSKNDVYIVGVFYFHILEMDTLQFLEYENSMKVNTEDVR